MQDVLPDVPIWLRNENEVRSFRQKLLEWGKQNFRSFPWRQTNNPYRILIAEVMLHRTQVSQVVPVYERFINQYPDLSRFARAKKEDFTVLLQPLGLHWRTDMIYRMGEELAEKFGMQIPVEKTDLVSLPGISDYIASAVRCFAWNIPEALIDTNTVRIVGRVLGWPIKDSSRRNKKFREALTVLVHPEEPRAYNYALLDLAHLVCLKKRPPLCEQCPLVTMCIYGQSGRAQRRGTDD